MVQSLVWMPSLRAARITGQVLTVAGNMQGRLLWQPAEIDAEALCAEHGLDGETGSNRTKG